MSHRFLLSCWDRIKQLLYPGMLCTVVVKCKSKNMCTVCTVPVGTESTESVVHTHTERVQVPPYYTVCVGVLYTPLGTAPGSGVRVKCEIVKL